jgi:beta-glucanase (GH16 family)
VRGGGGWGNGELEYYTGRAQNVALDGHGELAVIARREAYRGNAYTSARLQTKGSFAARYGRIEARIKLPAGQGLWPAFWLLGTDIDSVGWPNSGEIDVMENLGQDPFTFYVSIHGPQTRHGALSYGTTTAIHSSTSLAASFHVYGMRWTPNRVEFWLDGSMYAAQSPTSIGAGERWVFNGKPFYLLLNLAVGGSWPGPPSGSTHFPATMLVDWVRVYSS